MTVPEWLLMHPNDEEISRTEQWKTRPISELEASLLNGDNFWGTIENAHGKLGELLSFRTFDARNLSVTDVISRALKLAVSLGALAPGLRLVEEELARKFNVSRTPIREVLGNLGTEGVVKRETRGWSVRTVTIVDVTHAFEIRMALEGMAASLAAVRATGSEATKILELAHERSKFVDGDHVERMFLNRMFHKEILRAARNPMLEEIIEKNAHHYLTPASIHIYRNDLTKQLHTEHIQIAEAIMAGDFAKSETCARAHIQTGFKVFVEAVPAGTRSGKLIEEF